MSVVIISRDGVARIQELAGGSPQRADDLRKLLERAARDGGDEAVDLGLIARLEPLLLAVADARWWGEKVEAVSPEARAVLTTLAEAQGAAQVGVLADSLGKQRTTVAMLIGGLIQAGLVRRMAPGIVGLADPTLRRYLQRVAEEAAQEAETED